MSSKAQADGVDVGTVVANTYEIVSILGRGGMGTVWEAHHQRLPGKRVAIKVLHPSVAEDADALARFRREAEIACRLGHPNIVEVHDFNSLDDGTPYLVLELLEGESLDARLKAGSLSVEVCEQILRQVSSALQCAHEQGVVHRDLKPQNIFLVPSPTGVDPEIAKVLDFGISKIRGSQTVKTQESTLLGTPQYMAPEQATGQHDSVDARTDLFALAVMLYELLSGRPAFPGQNIPEVVYKVVHVDATPITEYLPALSAEKAAALDKAMSKAQADRFDTVGEFVEAFTGVPLAESRTRITPVPSDLAQASTVASNKIALGSAMTLDSQKMATPLGTNASDLASAATIDSQKLARGQAFAETIDSSKIDRQSTLMASQPALPQETQVPSGASAAPRSVPLRTLIIAMALMAGAAAAWILIGRASEDTGNAQVASQNTEAPTTAANAQTAPVALTSPDASVEVIGAELRGDIEFDEGAESDGGAETGDTRAANDEDPTREAAMKEETASGNEAAKAGSDDGGGTARSATKRKGNGTRAPQVSPPIETVDTGGKADAMRLNATARKLLADGDYDGAISVATQAYKVHRQPMSYEIKVKAHCRKSDLSNANGALRSIPRRYRKLRKQLESYCKKLDMNLDMRLAD